MRSWPLFSTSDKLLVKCMSILAEVRPFLAATRQVILFNVLISGQYFVHVFNNVGSAGEYYLQVGFVPV